MSSANLVTDALDVILRDGGTLRLRAPGEADREALVRFFEALSPRSLYLRFHGSPRVDEHLVEPVLEPDWVERGALLASVTEDGVDRIVALANYVRLRDPKSAEVAFAVADDYQGRGIATRMLERLAAFAGPRGIERFVGEVMADNAPMIRVFEGVGLRGLENSRGGEVEMTFPIAATAGLRLPRGGTRPHRPSSRPFAPSSKHGRSRSSAPRRAGARSEASSSGTSSRASSRGPYPSTATASPWPVSGGIARSPRSPIVDLAVICVPAAASSTRCSPPSTRGVRPSA